MPLQRVAAYIDGFNLYGNWADILRRAVTASGKTHYRLHVETKLSETQISRFMAGTQGLSLRSAEKLASVLGLELIERKNG